MLAPTATTLKPYTRTRGTGASAWYLDNILITFLATGEDTDGSSVCSSSVGDQAPNRRT